MSGGLWATGATKEKFAHHERVRDSRRLMPAPSFLFQTLHPHRRRIVQTMPVVGRLLTLALEAANPSVGGLNFDFCSLVNRRADAGLLGSTESAQTLRTRLGSMIQRRRRSTPDTFEDRIAAEKARLEAQVAGLPPGSQKDSLLEKISRLENASYMNKWLRSPGLRPPG